MDAASLTKLIVCMAALVAAVVLGLSGIIQGDECNYIIIAVLGYVFGNSHGVISGTKK